MSSSASSEAGPSRLAAAMKRRGRAAWHGAWYGAGLAAPVATMMATMLAAMLTACAVGPDFVRPVPPIAQRYTREPQAEATIVAAGRAQRFVTGARLPVDWWRLFQSAPLDA